MKHTPISKDYKPKAWFKKDETAYNKVGILSNTPFNQLLSDSTEENLTRSANAPTIRAGVIAAKVNWNAT